MENQKVVVTDIDMKFGTMVNFLVKLTFAILIAAIVIGLFFAMLFFLVIFSVM